jgi:hypothetical protein
MKIPINFPDDEPPLVRLKCYEPPGLTLELDRETLLRHLLFIGGTGAGKTSVVNGVLAQLLAAQVDGRPVGLLILDGKQDESVARVKKLAAEAGRSVQVLTPGGELRYDLFASLRTLDDVEPTAQRLLLGAGRLGGDNLYWSDMRLTLVDAALSLLVAFGVPVVFETAVEFMRCWFFGGTTDAELVSKVIQHTTRVLAEGGARLPAAIRRKLQQALDTAALWRTLDSRTRSNVQSTLLAAMRPLLSRRASLLFEADGHACFRAESVLEQGGVVVVSVNAVNEPDLARLLFRLVKSDFYRAVQGRCSVDKPLCFLVMDEYPLAASTDDLPNLQTLRSKNAGVIACTQGFISLDEALGVRTRQALIAGFQNIIAMRSHEIEIDALMFGMMGERELEEPSRGGHRYEDLIDWSPGPPRRRPVPVCPLGALARLKPFEAFVSLANGTHPPHSVWLEPRFVAVEPASPSIVLAEPADPLAEVIARIRGGVVGPASTSSIFELMGRVGGRMLMPHPLWQAAVELCVPGMSQEVLVEQLTSFFRVRSGLCPRGLESLPPCWLRALPRLLEKRAKKHWQGRIPFGLSSVAEQGGALVMEFAQEDECPRWEGEVNSWDVLRVHMNCHLYPSLWRPLTRRHWRQLHATRPELRAHLRVHAIVVGGSWLQ